jgi:molybdopterin synthase catalytic subunit
VAIAVAAPHRAEAFECCRYVIERVKTGVPIWKKSYGPDGATWIEGEPYASGP